MKIKTLINELEKIAEREGDIEVKTRTNTGWQIGECIDVYMDKNSEVRVQLMLGSP